MSKYQLLLLILLLTANKPLIAQNSDDIHPASIKNIEKLEHKNFDSKISEIIKTSLVMVMETTLSHLKSRLTLASMTFLVTSLKTDVESINASLKSNPSSTPFPFVTSIKSIICFILTLSIFKQALKQASDIKNISYDLINKGISTQKVLIKFSSFIGFLSGVMS